MRIRIRNTGFPVFRIRNRLRMDPRKEMPPGSGSGYAWRDADAGKR